MNYHNITKDDMNNGDGLRVVLWVAGCSHFCDECQNPSTWDENGGIPFDDDAKKEIFDELSNEWVNGITFSGGDPLFPKNRETVTALAKEIKEKFPNKTIWLYTGFTIEELEGLEILNYIDVLVDGEYKKELRNVEAHWVGSTNQRVIHLKDGKIDFFEPIVKECNVQRENNYDGSQCGC